MHTPYSYAEIGHTGLFSFDLSEEVNDPAVILWKSDESITLADHFSKLRISEAE